jgi:hypothetical protein
MSAPSPITTELVDPSQLTLSRPRTPTTSPTTPTSQSPSKKRDLSDIHPELHHHAGGDHHDVVIAESKVPMWIQDLFEKVFKIKRRGVTIELEIYTGW